MLEYVIREHSCEARIRNLTDVELEGAAIIAELPFTERIVVIVVVVKRLSDKILYNMLDAVFEPSMENLPDNVNDAVLPHWRDSHHHSSPIFELGLAKYLTFLRGSLVQRYAYLYDKLSLATCYVNERVYSLHSIPNDSHAASTAGDPVCRNIFSCIREPSYRTTSYEMSTSSSTGADCKSAHAIYILNRVVRTVLRDMLGT